MNSLHIDWCSYEAAKYAVEHWHYSSRMPMSKLARFGIWESGDFVGAIIFGVGATRNLVSPYGLKPHEGCELVRIAMTAHQTPVTKCVAIAIRMLRHRYPLLRLIVSYADPKEGHLGKIYQAGNWVYTGKTPNDRFPILDGRVAHPRTLSDRVRRGTASRTSVQYIRTPGKHRYVYPLDREMAKHIQSMSLPYPS